MVTTQPSEWSLPSWLDDTDGWHFAIGLHPWFALTSVDWSYLELLLQSHVSLSVGEIGLDGVVRGVDMQSQLAVFEGQCRLAVQYDRVISLHLVKDAGKGLSILKGLNVRRAIVHGFVGSLEQAISYQRLGFYLGLGPRLFRGMTEKRMHMLQHIDKELVLLESDTTSSVSVNADVIIDVATQLSHIWGVSIEEVSAVCDHNWRYLWRAL